MIFGIYPGGVAGTDSGLASGPPENPAAVSQALDALQGAQESFAVRAYVAFTGDPDGLEVGVTSPPEVLESYAVNGRKLDLVLCCRDERGDTAAWIAFVRNAVRRYGPILGSLQIGEEPNLYHYPGDGMFLPQIVPNLLSGVPAAKQQAARLGYPIQVGINSVPCFDPHDRFWTSFAAAVSPEFLAALDYVAFDFFPDVFHPVPQADLVPAVSHVLTHFRNVVLESASIPRSVRSTLAKTAGPPAPTGPMNASPRSSNP